MGEEGWRSTRIVGLPKAQRPKMELVPVNKNCLWPLCPLYRVRLKVWDNGAKKCVCCLPYKIHKEKVEAGR